MKAGSREGGGSGRGAHGGGREGQPGRVPQLSLPGRPHPRPGPAFFGLQWLIRPQCFAMLLCPAAKVHMCLQMKINTRAMFIIIVLSVGIK